MVTSARTRRTPIATKSRRCSRIARLTGPPPGSGGRRAAAGPFRSGTSCVWQGTSIRKGGIPPDRKPRAGRERRRDVVRPDGAVPTRRRRVGVRHPHELRAAAGLEAHEGPVAVEALALARQLGDAVEELAEVRLAGAERVGAPGVVDHHVAGRDQVLGDAAAEQADLREQLQRRVAGPGEGRRRRGEQLGGAAQLAAAAAACPSAPATASRRGSSPEARGCPAATRAPACGPTAARRSGGAARAPPPGGSGRARGSRPRGWRTPRRTPRR